MQQHKNVYLAFFCLEKGKKLVNQKGRKDKKLYILLQFARYVIILPQMINQRPQQPLTNCIQDLQLNAYKIRFTQELKSAEKDSSHWLLELGTTRRSQCFKKIVFREEGYFHVLMITSKGRIARLEEGYRFISYFMTNEFEIE